MASSGVTLGPFGLPFRGGLTLYHDSRRDGNDISPYHTMFFNPENNTSKLLFLCLYLYNFRLIYSCLKLFTVMSARKSGGLVSLHFIL